MHYDSIVGALMLLWIFLSLHQSSLLVVSTAAASNLSDCLVSNGVGNFSLPTSVGYSALLNSSIFNLRFTSVQGPAAIVLPGSRDELRHAILCARGGGSLAIRVRSGGHSYEGLSYTTENDVPFVVVDLANLDRIHVDVGSATAWAESGATLGQLYYEVGRSSPSLAFSGGSELTVGLGGHVSGGGFGLLSRKYALAADNVLDAVLIDADGQVLDRSSMGDDFFWAIRGGGGGSWGVVYSWKLRLVPVPGNVTVFAVGRSGPVDHIAGLLHTWQFVAHSLPDEFYLSVYVPTGSSDDAGNVSAAFQGQVLDSKERAMAVLSLTFPELALAEVDLSEMSWVEAAAMSAGVADLSDRRLQPKQHSKSKSDYVQAPISRHDMAGIIRYLSTGPTGSIQLDPYGGAMARVAADAIPFPHRAGNLYSIQYGMTWDDATHGGGSAADIGWLRSFYAYMARHVSKDPRAAYVNYLDLDLGVNNWTVAAGGSSAEAVARAGAAWGAAYFGENFGRLVTAKTTVDPGNVFNNAQSIPPNYKQDASDRF